MERLARRGRTCATREGLLHIMQIQPINAPGGGTHHGPWASMHANRLVGDTDLGMQNVPNAERDTAVLITTNQTSPPSVAAEKQHPARCSTWSARPHGVSEGGAVPSRSL